MIAQALTVGVTMAIGNFGHQLFTKRDWKTALERTWFQAIAIVATVIVTSIK